MPSFSPTPALTLSGTGGAARRAPLPVLVVDDEEIIRAVVRRALARDGWPVEEAADGAAALALLLAPERRWAAVVLDLSLPGLSGETVYARLRAERPELLSRVILSSGLPGMLADTAATAVLAKPFEVAALRAVVQRVAARTTA